MLCVPAADRQLECVSVMTARAKLAGRHPKTARLLSAYPRHKVLTAHVRAPPFENKEGVGPVPQPTTAEAKSHNQQRRPSKSRKQVRSTQARSLPQLCRPGQSALPWPSTPPPSASVRYWQRPGSRVGAPPASSSFTTSWAARTGPRQQLPDCAHAVWVRHCPCSSTCPPGPAEAK